MNAVGGRLTRLNPSFLLVIGAICISSSAIFVELADADAGATAFYRCLFALPFLSLVSLSERRRAGRIGSTSRGRAALAGIFFAIDLLLWTKAIYAVGAGIATVLGNLQVLFVALIAWIALREKPALRLLGSIPLAGAGAVLVSGVVGAGGAAPTAGILYGLGTALTYALFLVLLRSASGSSRIAQPLTWATGSAAVTALFLGEAFHALRLTQSAPALIWLLVLAVSSQTVGWLFIGTSLPRQPAAMSSLLLLVQPVAALLLAAVVLSQDPSVLQLAGAALIIAAVAIASTRRTVGTGGP